MSVVTLGATDRDGVGPFTEHFPDAERFIGIIELRGAGVGIDVVDLIRV